MKLIDFFLYKLIKKHYNKFKKQKNTSEVFIYEK